MGAHDGSNGGERDDARIRRRRNIAVALVLGGLVVLFFVMTMVRISGQYGP